MAHNIVFCQIKCNIIEKKQVYKSLLLYQGRGESCYCIFWPLQYLTLNWQLAVLAATNWQLTSRGSEVDVSKNKHHPTAAHAHQPRLEADEQPQAPAPPPPAKDELEV